MMPVNPRPETPGDGPGGRVVRRPRPLPHRRGPRGAPQKKKRSLWRIMRIVLLVWLVFLIAVPLWAWTKVDKVDAFPSGDRPDDSPARRT